MKTAINKQKTSSVVNAAIVCVFVVLFSSSNAFAQASSNPLDEFSWLIGSNWSMDKNSYNTFEWGLDRKSVISRSYSKDGKEFKLVSHGMWFWHAGSKTIKGFFIANNMPFELLEFTTRFEKSKMINALRAFDRNGKESSYNSTWTPNNEKNRYSWKLFMGTGDRKQLIMQGDYKKE